MWNIDFITEKEFEEHIKNTIMHYGEKLVPYDIPKFNSNLIDPVKLIFDKAVYNESWSELVNSEIFRQRDKSNTNEIGYFHQRMFQYIENCRVPANGQEGGWDVIFDVPSGYEVAEGNTVHTIFVEVKNKHNTMNSSAAGKTYIKMQNQLLKNDDCACFLVEAIASCSQNKIWKTTVDGQKVSHTRIRRVSIDKFYEIVTGDKDAFLKICLALPDAIQKVLKETDDSLKIPHDRVYDDLKKTSEKFTGQGEDMAMVMALYMLGFSTYNGFNEMFEQVKDK